MIKAKVFVVPNAAMILHGSFSPDNVAYDYDMFGISDKPGLHDPIIEIWVTDEHEDNWCCHGVPQEALEAFPNKREDRGALPYFPSNFPHRWLEGKKEGDTFVVPGTELELELCQTKFRYRGQGPFEDAVDNVMRRMYDLRKKYPIEIE